MKKKGGGQINNKSKYSRQLLANEKFSSLRIVLIILNRLKAEFIYSNTEVLPELKSGLQYQMMGPSDKAMSGSQYYRDSISEGSSAVLIQRKGNVV